MPLLKRFRAVIILHLIMMKTENRMFREEKEILDEMQSKLDELRGYL